MLLAARPTISFKKSEIKKTETTTRKRSNAAHLQFISYTNANCNSFCRTFFERSSDPLLVPSSTRTYFFLLLPSPVFAASSRLLKTISICPGEQQQEEKIPIPCPGSFFSSFFPSS